MNTWRGFERDEDYDLNAAASWADEGGRALDEVTDLTAAPTQPVPDSLCSDCLWVGETFLQKPPTRETRMVELSEARVPYALIED